MKIQFRIDKASSIFLDPCNDFQSKNDSLQVRFDPLTNRTGHFSHIGAVKPQPLDMEWYKTPEVRGFCPFCPENRDRATPKYPPDMLPEGRLSRGEACLIPNLYPYDAINAVTIMTNDHVVPLGAFTRACLHDAFEVGIFFLKEIDKIRPELNYHIMTWNYMPPSGGGIVHPHQQYLATSYPGNRFLEEYHAAQTFFTSHGCDYWSKLIRAEQETGERYIGASGNIHWLSSFVSLGLLGDITGIFPGVHSIEDMTEERVSDLVEGLQRIFQYFIHKRIYSFNTALFFGPRGQSFYTAHIRIVPRTFLNLRDFASDLNFYQALLIEPVSVVLPEKLCEDLRSFFPV